MTRKNKQPRMHRAVMDCLEPRRLLSATPSMVKDINPGALGSSPGTFDAAVVPFNGIEYFAATTGNNGREMWRTDGTAAGTYLFMDINPGSADSNPGGFVACGPYFYFGATDGTHGYELWRTDGTPGGTVRLSDIVGGSGSTYLSSLTPVGSTLYFTATTTAGGTELYKSDGSPAGTVLVKDINPGAASSSPNYLTAMNGILYFAADNGTSGPELWRSDGTNAGTYLVHEVNGTPTVGANINSLLAYNNKLYFLGHDGQGPDGPYVSDGTDAGTFRLSSTAANPNPGGWIAFHGAVYFTAGVHLWKTDGTVAGTGIFAPSIPTLTEFRVIAPDGLSAYITTSGNSRTSLYKTDGTEAGTVLVKSNVGNYISNPRYFGNLLTFSTNDGLNNDGIYGQEMWVSDGTSVGTHMLADINPGHDNSLPSAAFTLGDRFYFTANDGVHGTELWRSDGTSVEMVADLCPGPVLSSDGFNAVQELIVVGDRLFFQVNDGTHGRELWQIDATVAPPTAPLVNAGPDWHIAAGSPFTYTGGFFADPNDGDTWTATIDYGDGAGAVPLTLDPNKSFTLSHAYASPGSYTITVTVNDGTFSGSDTVDVAVSDPVWLSRGAGAAYTLTGAPGSPALHVTAGTVSLLNAQTFSDIAIDSGAHLDMTNRSATIAYTTLSPLGTWDGNQYTQLTGLITSGKITSSSAGSSTTVGIIDRTPLQQVFIKYTYIGDANLDGKINIDDYVLVDQAIISGTNGWSNGDFNYDGKVNIDDYVLIDSIIQTQGPQL